MVSRDLSSSQASKEYVEKSCISATPQPPAEPTELPSGMICCQVPRSPESNSRFAVSPSLTPRARPRLEPPITAPPQSYTLAALAALSFAAQRSDSESEGGSGPKSATMRGIRELKEQKAVVKRLESYPESWSPTLMVFTWM